MKLFFIAFIFSFSSLAMAKTRVYEIFYQNGSPLEVMHTDLKIASQASSVYRLTAEAATWWRAGASFKNVTGVDVNFVLNGNSSLVIYQGSTKIKLSAQCLLGNKQIICSQDLEGNYHSLAVEIDQ